MRLVARAALALAVCATTLVVALPSASAEGCVSRAEYDNLVWGLTTDQVRDRFETNGWWIATGDDFFRRGYDPCWTNDRKVVIWYDLQLGLSDHWDIRDR